MKTKKFSMFDLPTQSPLDLYLVGYEVGTGENGENKSVRVLASDLVSDNEDEFVESLKNYSNTFDFSNEKDGYTDTGQMAGVDCIQLSRNHFTTGKIDEIEVLYRGNGPTNVFLCVQVFTTDDDEDTVKTHE